MKDETQDETPTLKTIYICGPILNQPQGNRDAFFSAELRLLRAGFHPINPHNVARGLGFDPQGELPPKQLRLVMDAELAAIGCCDAIYLLRGWQNSRGAREELAAALDHGLKIIVEGDEA